MVTGVNGAKSTKQTHSAETKLDLGNQKDLQALKTLLALVFTFAAANNHNSTVATAGRYASAAGQAVLLMNQDSNAFGAYNQVAEKLVDNLAEALGQDSKKEAPEPVALQDRHGQVKDLRRDADSKETQMKSEISEVADDLGLKVKDKKTHKKKQVKKQRAKSFHAALEDLQAKKKDIRARLQKAQINGNDDAEKGILKELAQFKVQERILNSVPEDQRSKKGVLEKTQRAVEQIEEQTTVIREAQEPTVRRSFFGLFSKTDTSTTESKQRAIQNAKAAITEVKQELGITGDKTLSSLIASSI